jgi:hypothetical protein
MDISCIRSYYYLLILKILILILKILILILIVRHLTYFEWYTDDTERRRIIQVLHPRET